MNIGSILLLGQVIKMLFGLFSAPFIWMVSGPMWHVVLVETAFAIPLLIILILFYREQIWSYFTRLSRAIKKYRTTRQFKHIKRGFN